MAENKGTIEGFVAKSVLLVGIYFFVGSVYQQTYLRSLGVRVGLIDINQLLPNFTDPLVVFYCFLLWLIIAKLPERWYRRLAELVDLTTWRFTSSFVVRFLSLSVLYLPFVVINYIHIVKSGYAPSSPIEYVVPSAATFVRLESLITLIVIGFVIVGVYLTYSHMKREHIDEITKIKRRFLIFVLYGVSPFVIAYCTVTFGFIFPAFYGTLKAQVDVQRMFGTNIAKIEEVILSTEGCVPTESIASFYKYDATLQSVMEEVHYLGSYADNELFISFPINNSSVASPNNFELCIINHSSVLSIRFAQFQ